ncbi:MAG: Ig-like domain-containing protein, partial [Candidatus Eiseniibacteriota bacterium]
WTPGLGDIGVYVVTFTAANAGSGAATTTMTVTLHDHPPVVLTPNSLSESTLIPFSFNVSASDADGNPISSLTATGMPVGATFTPNANNTSAVFAWTPSSADTGSYRIRFTASNALAGSSSTHLTIFAKGAPSVSAPPSASVSENSPLTVNVAASDPDGDIITSLTASGVPAGAVFTTGPGNTVGTLSWTPSYSQAGSYDVVFTASNALSSATTTTITVANVDRAPVVVAPQSVIGKAGAPMSINVTASDPDGEAITSLSAAGPAGSNFSATNGNATGTWNWTPPASAVGTTSVTFTGANALSSNVSTSITVQSANVLPNATLLATPSSGAQPLAVTLDASQSNDPDGSIVAYRFDCGDGTMIGPQSSGVVPHLYAAGNWVASVTVTDNDGGTRTASVPITVAQPANLAGNPSFEAGLTGWSALGTATLTRVAGGADGVFCGQLNSTATTLSSFGINDHPDWVGNVMSTGTRYRFTAWVRSATSTGSVKIQVTEYLVSTGANLGSLTSTAIKLSPNWQMVTGDYTTKGGATATTLDFWIKDWPVALNEVFQVDNISIRDVTLNPSAPPASGGPATLPSASTDDPIKRVGGHTDMPPIQASGTRAQSGVGFSTAIAGPVRVEVQNGAGVTVRNLSDEPNAPAGNHSVSFDQLGGDGQPLSAGHYSYRITTAEGRLSIRFIIPPDSDALSTPSDNAAVASGATQAAGQTTEALAAAAQSDAQPSAPLIPLAPRIYPSPVHE